MKASSLVLKSSGAWCICGRIDGRSLKEREILPSECMDST